MATPARGFREGMAARYGGPRRAWRCIGRQRPKGRHCQKEAEQVGGFNLIADHSKADRASLRR